MTKRLQWSDRLNIEAGIWNAAELKPHFCKGKALRTRELKIHHKNRSLHGEGVPYDSERAQEIWLTH